VGERGGRSIVEKTYDCKDVCMKCTFSKWIRLLRGHAKLCFSLPFSSVLPVYSFRFDRCTR
jgi:hypothetical protein